MGDSGYIFKVEHTEFPGGSGESVKGREKSRMTLRFLLEGHGRYIAVR